MELLTTTTRLLAPRWSRLAVVSSTGAGRYADHATTIITAAAAAGLSWHQHIDIHTPLSERALRADTAAATEPRLDRGAHHPARHRRVQQSVWITGQVWSRDHGRGGLREAISLTGQFAAVDEILSGRENLVLIARLRHLKDPGRIADDLLERFSLTEAGARKVSTYSGGMRRRLDPTRRSHRSTSCAAPTTGSSDGVAPAATATRCPRSCTRCSGRDRCDGLLPTAKAYRPAVGLDGDLEPVAQSGCSMRVHGRPWSAWWEIGCEIAASGWATADGCGSWRRCGDCL
jgi:hypothetical protein